MFLALALGVLAVGAAASAVGARSWYVSRENAAQTAFHEAISETTTNLAIGLNHDADLTNTVRAFFVSQPHLTNVEFRSWFSLVGRTDYPDAIAFGYVQLVPAAGLKAFIARALEDPINPKSKYPAHWTTVIPPGVRPDYCLGRLGVWNLPVALPPVLDECDTQQGPIMRLAASSGLTQAGTVAETGQQLVDQLMLLVPGHPSRPILHGPIATDTMLLLYSPVYRNGPSVPPTVRARNAALIGWTVSVTDATQLLRTALGGRTDFQVELSHVNLGAKPLLVGRLGKTESGPLLTSTVTLQGAWKLHFASSSEHGSLSPFKQAAGILAGGIALSLLVFLLVIALIRSRTRAIKLVEERTKDLQHLALHDPLTGLPNRSLIYDRTELMLARARRHDGWAAALFIDLDNFKDVNDTLGHEVGDELLRAAAARLSTAVRANDTLGRLGGDEFVVLVESDHPDSRPRMIAERILEAFRQPFFLETQSGRPIRIGASIGIATGARGSAQEMLRDADVALYQAKALGKGRYEIFRSEMRRSVTDAVEMKAELYAADTNNEFFPVYQPIFDLETLEVTGVEALLRWNHPDRGLLLPGQFLPALEESGMIVEIGRLVLQKACAQLANWHQQKMLLSVNVNVSARQLDSDSLVTAVREALAASGVPPGYLVLEVTESAVMLNLGDAAKRLRALKSLGVKLAIDDFGTGYSSLASVQQLPVDVLKIDRSFISRLGISAHDSTLVRSVVELATDLGLTTVAEGIESQAEYDELRSMRAGSGQGYLFSHPLEVGIFEDLVRIDSRTGKVYMTDGPDRYPLPARTSTIDGSTIDGSTIDCFSPDDSPIDSAGPTATASLVVD